MFENYFQNPMKRKRLGLYGEDVFGAEGGVVPVQPAGMLNDPETTARIQATYPMKPEFNDAFVQRREQNDAYPVVNDLVYRGADEGKTIPDGVIQTAPIEQRPIEPLPEPAQNTPYPVVRNQVETIPEKVSTPYPVATQDRINSINNKDYSKAVYDENGNLTKPAGADRDKKWSLLEKIGNAAMGGLIGLSQGGIGGAIVGGVRGATDRNFNEKLDDKQQLAQLYPRLAQEQQQETYNQQKDLRNAQIEIAKQKPIIAQNNQVLAERRVNNQVLSSFYKNNPKFDASNPTEAQVRELASLGYKPEDVGSFNREKPIFADWLGSKMIWDSESGTFKDSGLDPKKNETLTEITIKNPLTNEVNTYTTTQDKAAAMKNSAANMGYQVIASKERQASQQSYQTQQTQQQQEFTLKRDAILQNMRNQTKAYDDAIDAQKKETDDLRKQEAEKRAKTAKEELLRLQQELKDLN